MYDAINTSGTGLHVHRVWIDVLANNIANVNTVRSTDDEAFRATYVNAQQIAAGPDGIGRGTHIVDLPHGYAQGDLVHDPDHPLADEQGMVRRPSINMSEQMGDLILAQRAFQANANTIDRSKAMYEAAINIGKGM